MENKEIEVQLKNPYLLVLIGFLLVVFYFELQLNLNSPIAFGDEGFHVGMARYIVQTLSIPTLEPMFGTLLNTIGYSYTPLFHLTLASLFLIFGINDVIAKIFVPIVSLLLGLTSFFIFKKVFSEKIAFIAVALIVTIPAIITYSVLIYVEIFMTLLLTLAFGFFLLGIKEGKTRYYLISGVFSGLAILAKRPAVVFLSFYGLYFIWELYTRKQSNLGISSTTGNTIKKSAFHILKNYLLLAMIIGIILSAFVLRNFVLFHTPLCGLPYFFQNNACASNIQYNNTFSFAGTSAQSGTGQSFLSLGLMNYFTFAYGEIFIVPILFALGVMFLCFRRNKLDIAFLIFFISVIPIFILDGSGRAEDLSRYTIYAVPAIAIVCAIYLDKIGNFLSTKWTKYGKYLEVIMIIAIITASIYFNFLPKITGLVSVKQVSPDLLQACTKVKMDTNPNSTILALYGAVTAYNCDRKTAWELPDLPDIMLSHNVTLATERLNANGINYIMVQKFVLETQNYREGYPISFVQFLESNNQSFPKVYENGPDYATCLQSGGCDGIAIYHVGG